MSVPQRHPLKLVQSCFPWPVPVSLHVSQALLRTASEQLARESHGRLIAAIAPGWLRPGQLSRLPMGTRPDQDPADASGGG